MDQSTVLAKVEAVFGHEKAQAWLQQPNIALNGKTPAEFIQTADGIREVEKIIAAIEYGGAC